MSQGRDKYVNSSEAAAADGSTTLGADDFSTGYRYYVLGLLLAIYTANYMDRMILGILLQPIKADLGASDTMMGLLTGLLFAIFYATMGMPIAWWADRGSRKTIITLALSIWSAMTIVCGLAANYWQLALARMFVGVGEAGGSPPSHSIISDLFPADKRSTALAIFALGVPLGLLFGFPLAGRLYEAYGWRIAFMSLGAPGLLLAVITWLTLREPPRGMSETHSAPHDKEAPRFLEVWAFMWSQKSLRHLIAGTTLAALVGYAGVNWLPSFLQLSHGMSTLQVSDSLALLIGIGGLIGTFGGGFFADYLGRKNDAWKTKIIGATILGIFPIGVLVYMTDNTAIALGGILFTSIAGTVYLGPTFSLVQTLVAVRMRALGAAIMLFILNLLGMSLGPTITGMLSDFFRPTYGDHSVRYALFTVSFLSLWSVFHFFRAATYLKDDLARVNAMNAEDQG